MSDEREDDIIYMAMENGDGQYAIWPADRELPLGWRDTGKRGPRPEVLAWIEEVWGDMRPPGIREKMDRIARESGRTDLE